MAVLLPCSLLLLLWCSPVCPVLYCVQCSSSSTPSCLSSPPSPTLCSQPSQHCLTIREYRARTKGQLNTLVFNIEIFD